MRKGQIKFAGKLPGLRDRSPFNVKAKAWQQALRLGLGKQQRNF